jgi:SAM-dependent methyltransferase
MLSRERASERAMETHTLSWEAAVARLRAEPGREQLVLDAYLDDDPARAARRYLESEELREVARLLEIGPGRRVLDVGAGNGVASVALAKLGARVVAVEPDPSPSVGAAAIDRSAMALGVDVVVCRAHAERLPFAEASFDAVLARQVLHHARDLRDLAAEVTRVLRPGGRVLAAREHVVSDHAADLEAFLAEHPLHRLYGGENAFTLGEYLQALEADLCVVETLGPYDSVLNAFPAFRTAGELDELARRGLARRIPLVGSLAARSATVRRWALRAASRRCRVPGRLYSFVAEKPA